MTNRSFYLYRVKFNEKLRLPNLQSKFSIKNKENILEIQLTEEEKKKHLLIIAKKEGEYLYGLFYRLKEDIEMSILDEITGEISVEKLENNKAWAEKSRFIFDTNNSLLLGEYNDSGIRFFQNPLGEYLRLAFNRDDLDIEVVYNKENYENLNEKQIKYIKIKVAKPKLSLIENIFGLSNLEVFNEADDNSSFFIELRINAGRNDILNKPFITKVIEKFNATIDKKGIKKFEMGQFDSDTPLELVKDKILKRTIDIENKSDETIFSEIINVYEDLDLNEILDLGENEN